MKTVESWWKEFASRALPPGAPEIQRQEMRKAFYAGAWAMLQGSADLSESTSEDEAAATLTRWQDEMLEYARLIASGHA